MPHYLVFGSIKRPLMGGGSYLDWATPDNPLGVYSGDTPDDACKAAAADSSQMGTFFAIEGVPWGLEMMQATGKKFGSSQGALERLSSRLDKLDDLDDRIARLTERSGD